jgi:hypothetical protein
MACLFMSSQFNNQSQQKQHSYISAFGSSKCLLLPPTSVKVFVVDLNWYIVTIYHYYCLVVPWAERRSSCSLGRGSPTGARTPALCMLFIFETVSCFMPGLVWIMIPQFMFPGRGGMTDVCYFAQPLVEMWSWELTAIPLSSWSYRLESPNPGINFVFLRQDLTM